MSKITMEEIIAYAKQYGFVYQSSEIYGGLSNSWDYGPLGSELKRNIKDLWWTEFVKKNPYNVGLDSSIILSSSVWGASGHLAGFSDPLVDCKKCNTRHRADHLIEDFSNGEVLSEGWENEEISKYLVDNQVSCPNCGEVDYTPIRKFNLMFKTNVGVIDDESNTVYLRPETAQGIFINYKNIARTTRKKLPFGVGQIGKSFRNEITPGNFIFRTREFEQMELEFFVKPGTELEWFDYWQEKMENFLLTVGLSADNFRVRAHADEELSHYSNKTSDFEYKFPFGWGELWGLASRTDFDLTAHQAASGQDMSYLDPYTNEKYIPYVIEPAVSVERLFLAILADCLEKEEVEAGDVREVLRIPYVIAPVKVAILPLVKKLTPKAEEIYTKLSENFTCEFDEAGTIGKRYRRQDVIGTPFCITIDYDTLEDESVTVRHRDTMEQKRIKICELEDFLNSNLKG